MKKSTLFKNVLIAALSSLSLNSYAAEAEGTISANASERYPTQVIARPGIMPTGIVGINVNGARGADKKWGLNADVETGIWKDWQASFAYDGVQFNDFKAKDSFALGLKYNYLSIPNLSFSAGLKLPLHVSGDIVKSLTLGLPITAYNDVMAGNLFGDLFTLHVRPNVAFDVDFNWWYGAQIYGNLWAHVSSSLGQVALKNPNNKAEWAYHGFWEVLPARVTAIYALNHYFDVSANAGFDNVLEKASENFSFGLGFTARAGSIFG